MITLKIINNAKFIVYNVSRDGYTLKQETLKNTYKTENTYLKALYAVKKSILSVATLVRDGVIKQGEEVAVYLQNGAVASWLYEQYSTKEYQQLLIEILSLVDELPILITYNVFKESFLKKFLNIKYVVEEKREGFDFDLSIEDE